MTRTLWETRETADQLGQAIRLEYYLLTEECEGMDQYGIEVQLRSGKETSSASCCRVTPQPKRATDLIDCLAQQTVTPTTLEEILQDLL